MVEVRVTELAAVVVLGAAVQVPAIVVRLIEVAAVVARCPPRWRGACRGGGARGRGAVVVVRVVELAAAVVEVPVVVVRVVELAARGGRARRRGPGAPPWWRGARRGPGACRVRGPRGRAGRPWWSCSAPWSRCPAVVARCPPWSRCGGRGPPDRGARVVARYPPWSRCRGRGPRDRGARVVARWLPWSRCRGGGPAAAVVEVALPWSWSGWSRRPRLRSAWSSWLPRSGSAWSTWGRRGRARRRGGPGARGRGPRDRAGRRGRSIMPAACANAYGAPPGPQSGGAPL